jgi:putative cell wall-binding protein
VRRSLFAVALVLGVLALPPSPAGAVTATRLAGADRYATAAAIAHATFSAGVPVAYVATGSSFVDALPAGAAAAQRGGPVLLTARTSLPGSTANELSRLDPQQIVVVGGPGAVSDAVVQQLDQYTDGSVTRASGPDRYATAAAVSRSAFTSAAVAYVAGDARFSDALAGGPAANVDGAPMLLVTQSSVPGATADELRRLGVRRVVVLGGTASVSDAVVAQLRSIVGTVERVAGPDRYETSVAVARRRGAARTVYLATGASYADALAGGAAASGPILLARGNCVPKVVVDHLFATGVERVVLFGGTGALGVGVERLTVCPYAGAPQRTPAPVGVGGPAWNDDGPDPQILRVGSTWYAFTTGTTWGNRIGVLRSTAAHPNTGWQTITGREYGSTALPSIPGWQVPDTQWAPGVYEYRGRWIMFYAAQVRGHGDWCVSVAIASRVEGPYTDASGGPMICQTDIGGSIDPQPFIDADGKPWLHWKNNDGIGRTSDVSKVWGVPLSVSDGATIAGPVREVMAKDTQRFTWQSTVDNPHMVLINGLHYLFYASGDYLDDTYREGYAICAGPLGPCNSGPQPILQSYSGAGGPAGGTVEQAADGSWWMSYHAYNGGERKMFVARLELR